MSVRIRQADENDIAWLLPQLHEFAAFFGSRRSLFPESDERAAVIVQGMLDHPFFIAESRAFAGRLGFIAGTLTPHPYNPDITVLAETFWWVDPAHRGTRAGALLLKHFEDYGRAHADWIVMTLNVETPVKEETLTRRGYRLKERSYLLEVNVPAEAVA